MEGINNFQYHNGSFVFILVSNGAGVLTIKQGLHRATGITDR